MWNRHGAPMRTGNSIEHPDRDLQPPASGITGKAAAEDGNSLVEHLMDMDQPSRPGVPRI